MATLDRMIRWYFTMVGCITLTASALRLTAAEITPAVIEIRPSTLDIERLVNEQVQVPSALDAFHNRLLLGVQSRLLQLDHRFLEPS